MGSQLILFSVIMINIVKEKCHWFQAVSCGSGARRLGQEKCKTTMEVFIANKPMATKLSCNCCEHFRFAPMLFVVSTTSEFTIQTTYKAYIPITQAPLDYVSLPLPLKYIPSVDFPPVLQSNENTSSYWIELDKHDSKIQLPNSTQ